MSLQRTTMSGPSAGDFAPVILGTGLTGIAVSRTLSARAIPHWLVGPPPGTAPPKLGESLNGEGTVDFLQFFPRYKPYWFEKSTLALYIGANRITCDLDGSRYAVARWFCRMTGFPIFPNLIHVDRIGFDTALFQEALGQPACTHVERRPGEVVVVPENGRIGELHVPGSGSLRPRFVFDASGFESVVPRALNLTPEPLGEPRQVAFTHYRREPDAAGTTRNPWELATSLVRLDRERDGTDGVGWCIPLGTSLSVGISVADPGNGGADADGLLYLLAEAFARRGLDYRKRYPTPTRVARLRHSHYVHERLFGPNWMLIGPSVLQIWFPSGAGVSTSLMGALAADKILRDPARRCRQYERLIRHFVATHWTHDRLWTRNGGEPGRAELAVLTDRLVNSTFLRLSAYVPLRNAAVFRPAAWLLHRLLRRGWVGVRRHCAIEPIPGLAVAPDTAEPEVSAGSEPRAPEARPLAIVERLFAVISGEQPLRAARALLHPEVRIHMDHQGVRGWGWWFCWVRLIRFWGGLRYRRIALLGEFETGSDGTVIARATWVGQRRFSAREVRVPGVHLHYRLVDGEIHEIWTGRANYRFFFGAGFRGPWVFRPVMAALGTLTGLWWLAQRLKPRPPVGQAATSGPPAERR